MEKVPVSVVVITRNEEHNIEDCLKSALWADEIVVADCDAPRLLFDLYRFWKGG